MTTFNFWTFCWLCVIASTFGACFNRDQLSLWKFQLDIIHTSIVMTVSQNITVAVDSLRSIADAVDLDSDNRIEPSIIASLSNTSHALALDFTRQAIEAVSGTCLEGRVQFRQTSSPSYTIAINDGIRLALGNGAHVVIILNSDTIASPLWLTRTVRAIVDHPDPCVLLSGPLSNAASVQSVPTLHDPKTGVWSVNPLPRGWDPVQVGLAVGDMFAGQEVDVFPRLSVLNGFCMAIARPLFEIIGLFNETAFPVGYGEEVDFCLRAGEMGYSGVIATNAYVYHKKTSSFSNDQKSRQKKAAKPYLQSRHPKLPEIAKRDEQNNALAVVRKTFHERLPKMRAVATESSGNIAASPKVLYLLWSIAVRGGVKSILQESAALRAMGWDVRVAVEEARYPADVRLQVESMYGADLMLPYRGSRKLHKLSTELIKVAGEFDAVIATFWPTAFQLKVIMEKNPHVTPFYYVQDIETWFYSDQSSDFFHQAKLTYTAPFMKNFTLFAKTEWIQNKLLKEYGAQSILVLPSYENQKRMPCSLTDCVGGKKRRRVLAMIRPESSRRNPVLTMQVLAQARQFTSSEEVEFHTFGCDDDSLAGLNISVSSIIHHGSVSFELANRLMETADILVDFSQWQAFGRPGLECAWSGCASVLPLESGVDVYGRDGETTILVDTTSPLDCLKGLMKLIRMDCFSLRSMQSRACLMARHLSLRSSAASIARMIEDHVGPMLSSKSAISRSTSSPPPKLKFTDATPQQIQEDLQPWLRTGIDFELLKKVEIPGRTARVSVWNGTVYAECADVSMIEKKLAAFISLISSVIASGRRIPNVVFVIDLISVPFSGFQDMGAIIGPEWQKKGFVAAPVLAMAKSAEFIPGVILAPNPYFVSLEQWHKQLQNLLRQGERLKWKQRINQVFWRGTLGPKHRTNLHRAELGILSRDDPLFNVSFLPGSAKISDWNPMPYSREDLEKIQSVPLLPPQPRSLFSEYKVLINMPGSSTGSYSKNLQTILPTGSSILNWNATAYEFYYKWLKEGKHLITVDNNNVVAVVHRLLNEPGQKEAQYLGENAREFAKTKLSARNIAQYFEDLFNTYAKLQNFDSLDQDYFVSPKSCCCPSSKQQCTSTPCQYCKAHIIAKSRKNK